MNKSTPITSRIQKRSIGGVVQPAIQGMGSVAKQAKPSPNKMYDSPAKRTPEQQKKIADAYKNTQVTNRMNDDWTYDSNQDGNMFTRGITNLWDMASTSAMNITNPAKGASEYAMKRFKRNQDQRNQEYGAFMENRTDLFGDGKEKKVKVTKPKPTKTKETTKTTKPYVKKGGKSTGNMKDYKIGSTERYNEYEARGWKQDATTKGGKPKVVKEAKVATTDNQANKNQFDKIKTPNIDLTRETKVKYKKSDVAKAPKTESLEPLSRSERKVARKKKSIDKKLAKAKVARESGNLKKAARKEKRAGNKVERKYGIRKQMRQTDRQTKQMNRGLDKLQKKTEKLLKENTK
jgi:hypothetical protein